MTDLIDASNAPAEPAVSAYPIWTGHTAASAVAMVLLLALADRLFVWHGTGISLAVYGAGLIVAVLVLHLGSVGRPRTLLLTLVAVATVLPFVESANLLWWPLAMTAVSLLAIDVSGQLPSFERWFGAMTRFLVLGPARLVADGFNLLAGAGERELGGKLVRLGLVWLVPVICAAIFAMLFVVANPVLELGLDAIRFDQLLRYLDPGRFILWGFFAFVSWPVLSPRLLRWTPVAQAQGPISPKTESLVFGAVAMRNSLLVFNVLFAVQTAMDLLYLWGGVRLPEGLSYADYAHHAAYPLIITAVLAGAFVLAAMRRGGPGRSSPLVRGLMYFWIAQNVWLVISSILRLKLYVEAYALSEMRIAAGVWMALVAVGLVLIVAKVALDRSDGWLVTANCVSLALALYAVAWIDFPAVISRYNVEHSQDVTGQGFRLDLDYLQQLGPGSIPAIDEYMLRARDLAPLEAERFSAAREGLRMRMAHFDNMHTIRLDPVDWQSWTWREERLRSYLDRHPFAPSPPARHN